VGADEERLLEKYRGLNVDGKQALVDYLDFLLQRYAGEVLTIANPELIPRPMDETVVGAMKRLKQTYPMLDTDDVFHRASALMAEHMLQGRDSALVIDDLEALFLKQYEILIDDC
jgi:hypothetical protein